MKILYSLSLILLASCNSQIGSSSQPSQSPGNFDINDTWRVISKHCGKTQLVVEDLDAYRIDASHLVRVHKSNDDETSLCKTGYFYERILSSFELSGDEYRESSLLRSGPGENAKRSCWRKEGGKAVGTPTDELFAFGVEELSFRLRATKNTLSLETTGAWGCPRDTLYEEAKR